MVFRKSNLKKYIRASLAGLMAVWLSGVLFLFCCEKMNAAVADADSCPLAKMLQHCDKAAKANSNAILVEAIEQNRVDCCGFLPAVFDKNRKVEREQKQVSPTLRAVTVKFYPPVAFDYSLRSYTGYVSISHQSNLSVKNCVFRI